MKFVENIKEEDYELFMQEMNEQAHFLQSIEWMKVSKYKGLIPHLVGITENGKIIATSLMLQKKLPLGYSYFQIPRGFTMNYKNKKLLDFFTKEINKYTKKFKSIYIKIDPDLQLHKLNHDGNIIEGENNYNLIEYMQSLGYKHLGYNKFFERSYPRYTFRINIEDDIETITSRFHQSSKQRIKKAETFGIKIYEGNLNDVEKFHQLMVKTEKKKDFYSHNLDFYKYFYQTFKEKNHVTLYIAEIDINETNIKIDEELKRLKSELENSINLNKNQKQTLTKQIEGYENSKQEFIDIQKQIGNNIILSSYMIVKYGKKCWTLYSCNEPKVRNAYGNYLIYKTQVINAHNEGYKIFDAFGTIGDPKADKNLAGLHEFKKKFGGEYIEFIGEFDFIQKKLLYFLFTKLVPYYRKFINKQLKRKNTN